MATPGTQYMMQAGLAVGMSGTQGMHSPHPKPVDPRSAWCGWKGRTRSLPEYRRMVMGR